MNRAERRQQKKLAKKSRAAGQEPVTLALGAGDGVSPAPVLKDLGELLEAGREAHEAGNFQLASEFYSRVLEIDSKNPDACHLLGLVHHQTGDSFGAVNLISQAIKRAPRIATYHNNLGSMLNSALNRPHEAIASYRRALAIQPDFAGAHNNMGIALQEIGRIEEAKSHFHKAIECDPHYAEAYMHLAFISRSTELNEFAAAMDRMYADAAPGDAARIYLGFGLAKLNENLGNEEKSFAFYAEANREQKRFRSDPVQPSEPVGRIVWKALKKLDINAEMNVVKYRNYIKSLVDGFDAALFAKLADVGSDDRTPIFVVGMPRSGTTLVEQILASHSRVIGAGELPTLDDLARDFLNRHSAASLAEAVQQAEPAEFASMGEKYVGAVRKLFGTHEFIVDKAPLNFHHIGLVRLILPNAKIIHCCRDPMDNGFSIFKRHFTSHAYDYACDLAEIGANIKLHDELMVHWRRLLPNFVYDIYYERLIADQKAETASLLQFCGLDWEEACLEFYKTERQVKTDPDTVRRPIYSDSVGAWKRFEKQLKPLIKALA